MWLEEASANSSLDGRFQLPIIVLLGRLPTWLFITYLKLPSTKWEVMTIDVRLSPPGPHGNHGTNQPLIASA